MVGGTRARRCRRTVGLVAMLWFCADASAQAGAETVPEAPASAELLLYLAEFEADADPVELSDWERNNGVAAESETLERDSATPRGQMELAREPD